KAEEAWQRSYQQLKHAREQQQACAPRLQRMRAVEHKIAEQRGQVNTAKENYHRKFAQLQDRKAQVKQARQRVEVLGDQMQQDFVRDKPLRALAWLEAHRSGLDGRVSQWERIEPQLHDAHTMLQSQQKELGQLKQDVDQSSNNRCLAQADREAVERERLSYQSQRDALLDGQVLAEIRREYAQLLKEKKLRRRIASLEEEGMRLQAGEPWPLWGERDDP